MSDTAEDRVRRICPRATAQRRPVGALGGGHYYVVQEPGSTELGRGDSEPEAWESAEKRLRATRFYVDDRGGTLRIDADQSKPGPPYRAITATEYYAR